MDLEIRGQSVIRVCFDAAFTILTDADGELRVEADATIRTPAGETMQFDPESPGAAAMHLAHLVRDVVTSAEAASGGDLRMVFESGLELTVAPHAEYEAWGLVGPRGRRVTCMPGGELALWSESGSTEEGPRA
jgi:hypothetical protein